MKKRFVCVAMVVILIGLSVMIWPVSAENQTSTSDSGFTLSVTKMIMAVGDVTYIDVTPIDVEPTWTTSDATVVSINGYTGVFTALKKGTALITASYIDSNGIAYESSCMIQVLETVEFFEENYYIEFQDNSLFMQAIVNDVGVGPHIRLVNGGQVEKWLIEKVSGDYYSIKSTSSNMYIGVKENNSSWVMLYDEVNAFSKWRIYEYRSTEVKGIYYVLTPMLGGIYSGRVLALYSNIPSSGSYVGLFDFFDTSIGVEWDVVCPNVYVNHYYDVSALNDIEIRNEIPNAHAFAQRIFSVCFGRNVYMNGTASYYDELTINRCTCGLDSHCTNSDAHDQHHKNSTTYYNEICEISRYEGHIISMWADRPETAYCFDVAPAFTDREKRIVFHTVRVTDQAYVVEYSSCMIFAHELSHCFGMPDVYPAEGDEDNYHTYAKGTQCIMNKIHSSDTYDFYQYLIQDDYAMISDAYCISCYYQMYGYTS